MKERKKKFSILKTILTIVIVKLNVLVVVDLYSTEHADMMLDFYSDVTTISKHTLRNYLEYVTIPLKRGINKAEISLNEII